MLFTKVQRLVKTATSYYSIYCKTALEMEGTVHV